MSEATSPTALADCAQVVKAYQKALFSSTDEESVYSSLLTRVSNTRSTASSSSAMLANLQNPPIPDVISSLIRPQDLGQAVSDISQGATELVSPAKWQEIIQKCIPCDSRVILRSQLLGLLPAAFLNDLLDLLKQLLGQLDAIIKILNSGAVYNDLCTLYKFFTEFVCIPDLQRIVALLGAILYRMSVNLGNGLDVIKSLVQPIFLPIFVNITALLGQFISLIVSPLDCVIGAIDLQLEKLDLTKGLSQKQVDAIGVSVTQSDITGIEVNAQLQQQIGIDEIQFGLTSSLRELKGFLYGGQRDLRAMLDSYVFEIHKFVNEVHGDMNYFDIQMEKLKIVRLINFITAVIRILAKGFECNSPPKSTTEEFASFLQDFFAPARNITVQIDAVTGETRLVLNTGETALTVPNPQVIVPTGNSTIDVTINKIVNRAVAPVTLKPQCLFSSGDSQKVAQWIAELDATEV